MNFFPGLVSPTTLARPPVAIWSSHYSGAP